MSAVDIYSIPKETGKTKAFIYALVVHLVLLAFLWIGIRWQSSSSGAIEAEVWDIKVTEAAPQAMEQPVVAEEIQEPVKQEEPAKAVTPDPDIALQEEKKKEKLKEEKLKEEKRLREAQLAKEEAAKKAADAKKKQESKARQKMHDDLLAQDARRLAAGGTDGSGKAAISTGGRRADASYVQRVGAKIKSNTIFNVPGNVSNQAVEYDIDLLPDGSIRGIRKRKPSGIPGFDEAVMRAIQKSAPFPPDKNGRVPQGFSLSHKPKD